MDFGAFGRNRRACRRSGSVQDLRFSRPARCPDVDTDGRPFEPVLLRADWFRNLPEDVRRKLLGALRVRKLVMQQRIFSRGEVGDGLYVVVEGVVCVSGVSPKGRQTILDSYDAGFCFGEVAAFSGSARLHDAEAFTDAVVVHLQLQDLNGLLTTIRSLFDHSCVWRPVGSVRSCRRSMSIPRFASSSGLPTGCSCWRIASAHRRDQGLSLHSSFPRKRWRI